MSGLIWLSFIFALGSDVPPVTEVWDVTRAEPPRLAYLADLEDCTTDMAAILSEAKTRLAGTEDTLVLYFPEGTYTFDDDTSRAGIYIDGFMDGNLIVRGAGTNQTTLGFNAISRVGFWVNHSNRVTVEHLHLTRPGYFASQFDVVHVDTNGVYLQIHEGFPTPEELRAYGDKWNGQEITLLPFRYVGGVPQRAPVDNKRLLHQIHGDLSVFPFTDLGDGLWYARFRQAPQIKLPVGWGPGDRVALKIRTGQNTLRFRNSNDCIARDLLITRFCGNPIRSFFDCNRLLIERVHIARPIGGIGGRIPFFSGSDGGIQLGSGREGPTVRDCVIESTADDAIGIFSNMDEVTSGVLIEGNTVYDGQARGILITQSHNGICRNNTLIRCNSYAVGIRNGIAFEGGSVTHWDIYENQFIDCLVNPVIGLTERPDLPETDLHDNIRIFNNTFIGAPKNNHLVYVDQTAGLDISDNTVVSFHPEEDYNDYGTGNALVYVHHGEAVSGSGNISMQPGGRSVWRKVRHEDQVDVEWAGVEEWETLYLNRFTGAAGGDPGWSAEVDPGLSQSLVQMELDGNGRLVSTATIAGSAFFAQLSETPLTAPEIKLRWTMRSTSESRWVAVGFHGEPERKLQDDDPNSGPWVLITDRSFRVRGGTGTEGTNKWIQDTHEPGDILAFEMSYYPSTQTVDVWLNGIRMVHGLEIEHEYPAGTPSAPSIRFVQVQIWQESLNDTAYIENLIVEVIPDSDPERVRAVTLQNFGGKADGITCNGPALMRAFAYAKRSP